MFGCVQASFGIRLIKKSWLQLYYFLINESIFTVSNQNL